MLFSVLLLLQYLFCSPNGSYSFDFIIHRNIEDSIESYFRLKFESTTQLCYGSSSPLSCTNFFISPNSVYSWIKNSTYVNKRRHKAAGDPHSDDYGQFYLQNELISEVYLFTDRVTIDSLALDECSLLFSAESKDKEIHSSIGLLRSMNKTRYTSFLEQLSLRNKVNNDELTIKYINKTAGRITFGELRTINDSSTHEMPIEFPNDNPQLLVLIQELSFNSKTINLNFKVNLDESFGFIQFPEAYKHLLDEQYKNIFNKYFQARHYYVSKDNNNYWKNITYYVCNKRNKATILRRLPEVKFTFDGFEIKLRKENMLVEYEKNQLIFSIVFFAGDLNLLKSVWVLGEPFLKDYDIEHNFSSKKVKLYQRVFEIKETDHLSVLCYFLSIASLIGLVIQSVTLFQMKNNKKF